MSLALDKPKPSHVPDSAIFFLSDRVPPLKGPHQCQIFRGLKASVPSSCCVIMVQLPCSGDVQLGNDLRSFWGDELSNFCDILRNLILEKKVQHIADLKYLSVQDNSILVQDKDQLVIFLLLYFN